MGLIDDWRRGELKWSIEDSMATIACHDARTNRILEKALATGVLPFDKHGNQTKTAVESIGPGEFSKSKVPAWADNDHARKFDGDKLRFDLLPADALKELVSIYTYGAKKYADRNWEKGLDWSRPFAALQRHLWAYWGGENIDPESGLPHLAHAAWGCLALLEYARIHPGGDDRPIPGLKVSHV